MSFRKKIFIPVLVDLSLLKTMLSLGVKYETNPYQSFDFTLCIYFLAFCL